MKLVTFAAAMAPYGAGDRRLIPDALAAELHDLGALSASEPWPGLSADGSAAKPVRPMLKPVRPAGPRDGRQAR